MANAFNGSAERAASTFANLRILDFTDRPWPVPTGGPNSSATDCPSKAPYVHVCLILEGLLPDTLSHPDRVFWAMMLLLATSR